MRDFTTIFREELNDISLARYLAEIDRIPLLSAEEERRLAEKIQKGDQEALNKLIEANLRFVVSVAKRYTHHGIPLADLINQGNLGLIEAAKRFDPSKGFRFTTYAIWWIKQAILLAIADQSKIVRLPLNKAEKISKVKRAFHSLALELGREPTIQELAIKLDMTPTQVREILNLAQGSISLEAPAWREGDAEIIDFIEDKRNGSSEDKVGLILLKENLRKAMENLTPFEREIITLRYGLGNGKPLTLKELAKRFRFSKERIRQIEKKALKQMRYELEDRALGYSLN